MSGTASKARIAASARPWWSLLVRWADSIFLRPAAEILLLRGAGSGLLIWLVLALTPRLALAAMAGSVMGELVRRTLAVDDTGGFDGCLKVNALLAAVMVAAITAPAQLDLLSQAVLICGAAALAAWLGGAIRQGLRATILPPMVWSYCAIAIAAFTIFPEWTYRAALATDWGAAPAGITGWAQAFLRSLGSFLFSPSPDAGLLIAVAILLWSPIMFFHGAVGWLSGVLAALAFQKLGAAHYWLPVSYNFFIAGMALGAVRFMPHRYGTLIAAAAGMFAAIAAIALQYLLKGSSAAYLPVTFMATVWVFIGALRGLEQRGVIVANTAADSPPEQAWRTHMLGRLRWGWQEPLLAVPIGGVLSVAQGFAGRLSHAGNWRHALDLQRRAAGQAASEARESLWDAPVFAPAPGVVEAVRNDVPDNPVGTTNFEQNWGNYVVIRMDQGFWAMVAHLRQASVMVSPGQRVGYGSYLGTVGNSGRSPSPHLHVQVQGGAAPGTPTQAFRMANFLTPLPSDGRFLRWHAAGVPAEGTALMAAPWNRASHALLSGMVPGRSVWSVEVNGHVPRAFACGARASIALSARLDDAGRCHYRSEPERGSLVTRLDADAWRPIGIDDRSVPLLRLIALGAPAIPYAAVVGMCWEDVTLLPVPLRGRPFSDSLLPFVRHPFIRARCLCLAAPEEADGRLTIQTDIEGPARQLPARIVLDFCPLRGVVSVVASFARGSLACSMLSFEPAMPLATDLD